MNNKISNTQQINLPLTMLSLAVIMSLTGCEQRSKNAVEKQENQVNSAAQAILSDEQKSVQKVQKRQKQNVISYAAMPQGMMHASVAMQRPVLPPNPVDDVIFVSEQDRENYLKSQQNPVKQTATEPVSTFSIDVDTGSYSNTRRMLNMGKLPPSDALREEAFINYFDYDYSAPETINLPFKVHTEVATAPWNEHRQLVKIGIKGFEIEKADLKAANLVFLLDVSGSMNAPNKLPLLKTSLTMLTKQLDENDSVAIVVYAGAAGVVLPATKGNDQHVISAALDKLAAGGSTNGEQGIELAYQIAQQNFKKGGINRVILATDGDFNVGMQSVDKLKELVAAKRKTGVALTTLGFGQGNYNDGLMEQLANISNGQHAYIDNINEARKVLVDELSSSMQIIAKDVKIQVEFNPQQVAEYRLIGYQNRMLASEDFNNDKVDAAELGAGHTVTALYEITLANSEHKQIDELRYQSNQDKKPLASNELAFVKVRYKQPDTEQSELLTQAISSDKIQPLSQASSDFKFAAAVAGFAQLLKGAKYTRDWQYEDCAKLATANKGIDTFSYRSEFVQLVNNAAAL
ncbi:MULTISPECIES: VWA domain-containing protein [unclassified Pseudoalteromonas]|uniref:vWA domain-containing protein n=1 Tax=unclassified Pseudoalteromonas TaxID=194690 RepID=UPI0025B6106E|nr:MULTISPECIES: VWA domain-containing protein [unclassified Pseudoalteromonas]MDN3379975.1 VWA domain-containing protein [Pseudoalteromonas sp. APC 3893]MDN3388314.1 VWA domain-containing protein [Pseudoalteromonas sp. APC 4017]